MAPIMEIFLHFSRSYEISLLQNSSIHQFRSILPLFAILQGISLIQRVSSSWKSQIDDFCSRNSLIGEIFESRMKEIFHFEEKIRGFIREFRLYSNQYRHFEQQGKNITNNNNNNSNSSNFSNHSYGHTNFYPEIELAEELLNAMKLTN